MIENVTMSYQEYAEYLYDLRDKNPTQEYLIVNSKFNERFKDAIFNNMDGKLKVTLDTVAGFKYIVSPYFKEKETPVAYICVLDLNKVAGVNSTFNDETIYIEDILFNNIAKQWTN